MAVQDTVLLPCSLGMRLALMETMMKRKLY